MCDLKLFCHILSSCFYFSSTMCASGYFSLGAAASCAVCPAGSSCASPSDPPIPCSLGMFSSEGSINCTECPAGYQCPTVSGKFVTPPSSQLSYSIFHTPYSIMCLCPKLNDFHLKYFLTIVHFALMFDVQNIVAFTNLHNLQLSFILSSKINLHG